MKRAPGVQQRPGSNVWQWGIKAPKDLRHVYQGQWAHRCSLETSDLRAANERAAVLRADWLTRFASQRDAIARQAAGPAAIQLTPDLIRQTADLLHARMLESDDAARMAGLTAEEMEQQAVALEVERKLLSHAYAGAAGSYPIENILPAWLETLGLEVAPTDPLRPALVRELVKARLKAIQARQARHAGELVDTPPEPPVAALEAAQRVNVGASESSTSRAAPGTPRTLREVFTRWKAAKKRSKDAVNACERALELFEDKCGTPRLQDITRAMGDEFRAHLLTLEFASKTKHMRMTDVKSLLKYACRDLEVISRNPWEGLDIAYKTEKRRTPWSADQLATFFGLPLFTAYDLPKDSKAGGAAAYWVPLLGLFTGARVGELCQLRVADIEEAEDGAFLHITEEAADARVKTEAGLRSVPIHSELIRLGFLDYVRARRSAGDFSLWPTMRFRMVEGVAKPGAYYSDWFGEFRRKHAASVPDFHSLRHTVRTAMTEARIAEPVQDRITGHEVKGSTGTRVYAHPKAVLREAVESIKYPRLVLPVAYLR